MCRDENLEAEAGHGQPLEVAEQQQASATHTDLLAEVARLPQERMARPQPEEAPQREAGIAGLDPGPPGLVYTD